MQVISLLDEVLEARGWDVRSGSDLNARFSVFDSVGESETAVVFFKLVSGDGLQDEANQLAGDVASATLATDLGAKAWESYLVLVATELELVADDVVQNIQHNLSYCRKIVLDADRILRAKNPRSEAESLVSFLFPLEMAVVPSPIDVRQALVSKLIEKGTPLQLAQTLIENFEETDCSCPERILAWVNSGGSTSQ